ncbi:NnrS family protein [Pseudochrobactrum sp. sp1633]|uniref:NnrS family protein n=1 Tax=Pseudochrobactrum sp. sp1633 TaxID=3036706 RepID=UPI0025A50AF7|nr:NnrS family protein [Pseudochrobactrum sp. sp1633]MDM8346060.1 NnrS family protein [Pseudochrobactrum sp. sp1633]
MSVPDNAHSLKGTTAKTRKPVPRGLKMTGPVIFSYGFRPFFLGAGIWAVFAMLLWILSLTLGMPLGGSYDALNWHAHEMLFGFGSAVLAGFLLTAVPNWTGSLPVSGTPLIVLSGVWLAGRLAFLYPDLINFYAAIALESLFLPLLLAICAREIIAGHKWKDLKVLIGLGALTIANLTFHYTVITGGDIALASRIAVSAYMMLIMIIGGRIVPSFTRNWLNRNNNPRFPVPFNRYGIACLIAGAVTLLSWIIAPDTVATLLLACLAAVMHSARLIRWRGWQTYSEKLLLILHIAYAFIPAGFIAIALSAAGLLNTYSTLHIITVGAIGGMMLAVMGRATRGHTGNALNASLTTSLSYICLVASALIRPFAEIILNYFHTILAVSALLWIAAFALFVIEYAPMLVQDRRLRSGE